MKTTDADGFTEDEVEIDDSSVDEDDKSSQVTWK